MKMEPIDTIRRNVQDSMQTQVENYILGKIDSSEWPVDTKIPSERDLSIRLDVSRTTVRNAIQELTSRGMFDRKIGQGTFVRFRREAGAPRREASKGTFGYVVCKERSLRKPISSEAFYFDVFSGIEEESVRSGRHVLFSYLDDGNADEVASFKSFLDKVDGLVIEEARDPAFLEMILRSDVPAALLAPTATHERLDCVTMDIGTGVRKAVCYLASLGHERIAIVNGPLSLESARVRFAAWKDESEGRPRGPRLRRRGMVGRGGLRGDGQPLGAPIRHHGGLLRQRSPRGRGPLGPGQARPARARGHQRRRFR